MREFVIFSYCCRKTLCIPPEALKIAETNNFDIKGYIFEAKPETTRPARIVRIGAVQNSIVSPTNAPIVEQREAIFHKIKNIIDAAAISGVNVLCLQEAWSTSQFLTLTIFFEQFFTNN